MSELLIVTIDGGAATGKSTTARALAERMNLLHVDTGSHYRAITLAALRAGILPEEGEALNQFLATLALGTVVVGTSLVLTVSGAEVNAEELRSDEVNRSVSQFAALKPLRARLLYFQRSLAEEADRKRFRGLVVEGRDIGSVVFPNAAHRFFLEADPAMREARREAQGEKDLIQERDLQDSGRATAPFLCPPGAVRIDTGNRNIEEVISLICEQIDITPPIG
ncbi:MAG: (d)CMP kinase [Puniceicoccaceae bacterium]